MIVANATFETRALFGVGGFAYSDPGLDGRLSTLGFSVFTRRARAAAPSLSFSVPLPVAEQGSSFFFVPSFTSAPPSWSACTPFVSPVVPTALDFALSGSDSVLSASDFRFGGTASIFVPAQLSWLADTLISYRCGEVAERFTAVVDGLSSWSAALAITVYGLIPAAPAVVSGPRRKVALRPRSDSRLSVRPVYFNFRRALRL